MSAPARTSRNSFTRNSPPGIRSRSGIGLAATLLVLAGCAAPRSSADLERQTECGREADQQFNKQNRYQLSEEDQSSSPYSSNGLIGVPNKGLNDEYRRDRLVDDCLHSAPETTPALVPGRN